MSRPAHLGFAVKVLGREGLKSPDDEIVARLEDLLPVAQRRLVVENDDGRFGAEDVLWLHDRIGVRVVFDVHRHHCYNPSGREAAEVAWAYLATWRAWDARPKR